jgi:hypothetical protein
MIIGYLASMDLKASGRSCVFMKPIRKMMVKSILAITNLRNFGETVPILKQIQILKAVKPRTKIALVFDENGMVINERRKSNENINLSLSFIGPRTS